MRLLWVSNILLASFSVLAVAQGTPPPAISEQVALNIAETQSNGAPPSLPDTRFRHMTSFVKARIRRAIDGRPAPSLQDWKPLSTREKFYIFIKRTYAPGTFAGAGVDALKKNFRDRNPEYERGMQGLGQRIGINLATSESDAFFQNFLVPSLLKEDPRYFRNPELPFLRRAVYSMSRVVIARSDKYHETFNGSKILGGAASQALSDLYVPGQAQGLHPVIGRVVFNLARDAGFNLVHEFWPDVRKKLSPTRLGKLFFW